jgi:hypothetical protein
MVFIAVVSFFLSSVVHFQETSLHINTLHKQKNEIRIRASASTRVLLYNGRIIENFGFTN